MKTKKKTPKTIKPESFKKLWKTKKATENIDPILLDIVKEYWVKVHKPQWNVTRRDLADRVFSEYIRLKHADSKWMCKCVTCWAVMPWTEIQNWHFITRGNMKFRFSEENCHTQCYKCNCILSGNYQYYTMYMIDRYWKMRVQEMMHDKSTIEIKQYQYEEMIIEWYQSICQMITELQENKKKYKKS